MCCSLAPLLSCHHTSGRLREKRPPSPSSAPETLQKARLESRDSQTNPDGETKSNLKEVISHFRLSFLLCAQESFPSFPTPCDTSRSVRGVLHSI